MSDGVANLMRMLNYKLVLSEEHSDPYIFYKDEGRKDKCIVYSIQLFDEFDCLVRTRIIPLKVTLLYSNGTPCTQDILSLSPDSRLSIDTSGTTVIKARINAVSKGHQSQMFRIQIEEDTGDPNKFSYITPVCSVPVEVRSKRNNLKRKFADFNQFMVANGYTEPLSGPGVGATPSIAHSTLALEAPPSTYATAHRADSVTLAAASPSVLPAAASAYVQRGAPSVVESHLMRHATPAPSSATTTTPGTGNGTGTGNPKANDSSSDAPCAPASHTHVALDAAVDAVLRWAGTVMNGLQDIQWRCIGYERAPDGSTDTSRPLFSMTNPSQVITEIIQLYSQETMASLQALVKEAEEFRRQAFRDAVELLPCDEDDAPSHVSVVSADAASQPSSNSDALAVNSSSAPQLVSTTSVSAKGCTDAQSLRDKESEVAVSLVSLVGGCCHLNDLAISNALTMEDDSKAFKASSLTSNPCPNVAPSVSNASSKSSKLDFNKSLIMKDSGHFIETFDWSNSNTEMLLGMAVNSDRKVHYIVSKIFKTCEGSIGLPAYDDSKQLIGFYRESMNCNRNIVLKYRSVNAHRGIPLASLYVKQANDELEELCKESSPKVFSLYNCRDDLERMKQDALIYSWMSADASGMESINAAASVTTKSTGESSCS